MSFPVEYSIKPSNTVTSLPQGMSQSGDDGSCYDDTLEGFSIRTRRTLMQRTRDSHPHFLNGESVLQNVPGGNPQASLWVGWEHINTMVPDPGNVQAWDRYAYVLNNPLGYIDPSGHGYCDEKWADPSDCAEADPNGNGIVLTDPSETHQFLVEKALESGYDQDDINRGYDILNTLKNNKDGWWNQYIDWSDPESIWRFILSLAFTYETYSLRNDSIFIDKMITAFSNQFWDLMYTYGDTGGFIYIGTMETLNIRVGSQFNDIDTLNLRPYLEQTLSVISITIINQTEMSRTPNDPYDFGSCPSGCIYNVGIGIDQAIWKSWDNKAYIRSRYQFFGGK